MRVIEPLTIDGLTVNEILVTKWEGRFYAIVRENLPDIGYFSYDIKLVFSDEIKENKLLRSFDDAKKELLELCGDDPEAKKVIENAKTRNDLWVLQGILDRLRDLKQEGNIWEDVLVVLDGIAEVPPEKRYAAGEYHEGTKTITLYHKVIRMGVTPAKSLSEAFEEVFIHELFHAYHYAYCRKSGSADEILLRRDYTSSVVKEGLAAFFEKLYCDACGIATTIADDWDRNDPHIYPYAAAKYIADREQMRTILGLTLKDMDGVLRTLLSRDKNEFYDVKNVVTVRYKEKKVPAPVAAAPVVVAAPVASSKGATAPTVRTYSLVEVLHLFKDWLRDNGITTPGSASSYVSYTDGAIKKVLAPFFAKLSAGASPYDRFTTDSRKSGMTGQVVMQSEVAMAQAIAAGMGGYGKKLRSGLRAFFNFMDAEGIYFDFTLPAAASKKKGAVVTLPKGGISYTHKELMRTFKSRLVTQDRAYDRMLYCARVINRIFNKSTRKADYAHLLETSLENILFLVEDGGAVKLKDIEWLSIQPSMDVLLKTNDGKKHVLYARERDGSIRPLRAPILRDLSIDHVTPLVDLLNNDAARRAYPRLRELSDRYAGCADDYLKKGKNIRDFCHHSSECFRDHRVALTDPTFVNDLLAELEALYTAKISFEIIRKDVNSYKGGRTLGASSPAPSRSKAAPVAKAANPPIEFRVGGKAVGKDAFAEELIRTKAALFRLTYASGLVKESPWKADRFDDATKLMNNIHSRPFWREGARDGLVRVEVLI